MDKLAFEELEQLQNTYWWFVAKREIICSLVGKYRKERIAKKKRDIHILDAGCGMGVLLNGLSRYGNVCGMDVEEEAVLYCRTISGSGMTILKGKLPDEVPFPDRAFDIIVSADCLEHIEDDYAALVRMREMLKDEHSFLLLTVPALMCLWSYNDEFVHHYRRYHKRQLTSLLQRAGYQVEMCSYYNFWTLPAVWMIRKLKNLFHIKKDDLSYGTNDGWMNQILTRIFSSEKRRLLHNKTFPAGVSLCVVAVRK